MSELADRFVAGRKGAQISGVLLTAVGVFLFVSLVTHSEYDPPGSSHLAGGQIINWTGRIGAHVSYGLLTGVGISAYALPLLGLLWGWNRMRHREVRADAVRSAGILGLAAFLSVASGLPKWSPYTAFELGGWFGTWTTTALLVPYAGRVGSTILLTALLLASLMLATDLDPRRIGVLMAAAVTAVGRTAGRIGGATVRGVGAIRLPRLRRREAPAELRPVAEPTEADDDFEEEADGEDGPLQVAADAVDPQIVDGAGEDEVGEDDRGEDHEPEEDDPEEDDVVAEGAAETPAPAGRPPSIRPAAGKTPKTVVAQTDGPEITASPPPAARTGNGAATPIDHGRKNAKAAARPAKKGGRYRVPGTALLDPVPDDRGEVDREVLLENARILEEALGNFDVTCKVVEVSPGPVVTRYEVEPAAGVKVHRISALADDLARVMSAQGIRIQAPVPGRSVVGVEIANHNRETVYLREIVDSPAFKKADSILTMALGKTISGDNYVADLGRMPHLLVAGATGAGKSVCINGLICSILLRATPEQVRLLMVDPKVVELTMYNDIPHLLAPVITEPKKASEALKWAVAEMEVRYQKLARMAVRNLSDYNAKVGKVLAAREAAGDDGAETADAAAGEELRQLPFVVIVIDEFADLMLTAPADVETSLMLLAQKSRAVGIHIILATQRPSVNVITGVIKANFPSRIAFQVASKIDSRTILDMNGAERLLGRGDMLFLPGGQGEPVRVHGAFISGEETERLVQKIKESGFEAEAVEVFAERGDAGGGDGDRDELFDEAVNVVLDAKQASTSFLQRRMKVGYSRAARLMDELEFAGIVGPAEGAKPREILVETAAYDEDDDQ